MSAFLSEMLMSERKRTSARRNLFGALDDNDRAQLHKELDNQSKRIDEIQTKEFMNRWGFDPVKGAPIQDEDNKFEYTLVDNKSLPACYTSVYKHRPTRPVWVRSPCSMRNSLAPPKPTKRKLRFDTHCDEANDENREVASDIAPVTHQLKVARFMDIAPSHTSTNVSDNEHSLAEQSSSLSSPPASPQVSSLHPSHCPPSPSVLSSSCPPVFESDSVRKRLQFPTTGLTRSVSESSFEDLSIVSPNSQAKEYTTPSVRPIKLVQSVITDYGSIKKKRTSGKATPRS